MLAWSPMSDRPTSRTVLVTLGSFISGTVPWTRSRLERTSNSPSVSRSRSRSRPSASSRSGALRAVLPEPLDDRVKALDEERLRREHISAAAHHAAVSARSREADLERIGSRPHQARPRDDRPRLEEARDMEPDHRVGVMIVEQALGDHRLGAFDYL